MLTGCDYQDLLPLSEYPSIHRRHILSWPFYHSWQLAVGRNQRSEIRRLISGVELIFDLRLLTSVVDDFNDLDDLSDFNGCKDLPDRLLNKLIPCL